MQDITIAQAQQQVDEWIKVIGVKYFSELTNLGILMEEVGELSRIMVRTYGNNLLKKLIRVIHCQTKWLMYCGCLFALPTKRV